MPKFSFEEILSREGKIVYTNSGISMMPLLRPHRDIIVIEPKQSNRLKIMDCPVFKRDDGTYVLHRVMWVCKTSYIICGDNQWYPERGVTDQQIIGVLTTINRNGKQLKMNSLSMRLYSFFVWITFPVRACVLFFFRSLLPRIKNKFFS